MIVTGSEDLVEGCQFVLVRGDDKLRCDCGSGKVVSIWAWPKIVEVSPALSSGPSFGGPTPGG